VCVVGFHGREATSRLYRFDVFLIAPADDLDFELSDVVGTKARLALGAGAGILPCFFAGIVGDIELIQDYGGKALLRVVIVPRLADLALSRHSRVFTDMSAIDVIKAVLEENGVTDYESHVGAAAVEEHICQYRESDLDFISRWMEREGIRYSFEHREEGEKLILADDATYPDEPLGTPVRYYPQIAEHWSGTPTSFRAFSSRHTSVTSGVKVRDNDYARPSLKLSGAALVSPTGSGEVNLYGERFWSPGAGQRLAQIRAQEQITRKDVFHALGARLHLHAGYAFELEDHPRAAFNARYLVTEAHHYGNQATGLDHFKKLLGLENDDLYLVDVSAISAAIQFRPASATPWPRIYGFEGAVVDGAATSEYAQIDAQGRYNVKFHFDESALENGKASTLVRMMQPHGGDIEGFHFPLRKGTEVVVSFLGGDPDRPVISGVVPNTLTPSAVTSGNHTKNVIQTGGRNRFELEDQSGQERVTLSTPLANSLLRMGSPGDAHHVTLRTDGKQLHHSGSDFDVVVESSHTETITVDKSATIGGNHHKAVTGNSLYTTQGNHTTEVEGNHTTAIQGDTLHTIQGTHTKRVQGDAEHTIFGTSDHTVRGATTQTFLSTSEHTILGTSAHTVHGTATQTFHADLELAVTGNQSTSTQGNQSTDVSGTGWASFKGDYWENYKANKGTFVIGGYETVVIGGKSDIIIPLKADFIAGLKAEFILGDKMEVLSGAKIGIGTGPKIETWAGVRARVVAGLETVNNTLHITDTITSIGTAGVAIKDFGVNVINAGIHLFD
jgi:type VI secretion system secreted protein VgrG